MWLESIQLKNIRGFVDSGFIKFSKGINLLVVPNNSGKSTILRSIYLAQSGERDNDPVATFFRSNQRLGTIQGQIVMRLEDVRQELLQLASAESVKVRSKHELSLSFAQNRSQIKMDTGQMMQSHNLNGVPFHKREPHNFIYPYFSRRKPSSFEESVNASNAQQVAEDFATLFAKIDRLSNRDLPEHESFRRVAIATLGFSISCAPSSQGKQAGLIIDNNRHISIANMGEGTVNIMSFLAHLSLAHEKLFLIEEIENDIHPRALKALLEFILEKSETNQFIISTHSNIVARYLGGTSSKVYSLQMELGKDRIPISKCEPVGDTPEARFKLLESLGYDSWDFDVYKGYLILEESTAEVIIRNLLIPKFFPKLQTRLRTVAASGVADVEPRFSDLIRLFVFVHTAPQYQNRAWVAVDNGSDGQKTILKLKEKFKTWPEHHFRCFSEENFEKYYPCRFSSDVSRVLAMPNGLQKQREKGKLAESVLDWATNNPGDAKNEFETSAAEVLSFLQEIEQSLA